MLQKYKSYNARVEHKGNETLIKSIVENVGRMLQRKIDAVRVSIPQHFFGVATQQKFNLFSVS